MTRAFEHTTSAMGTVVSIRVLGDDLNAAKARVARAFEWFTRVEAICSRFEATSELRQLVTVVGEPVAVSDILFEAVRFALVVAESSNGAFDPTIGATMEASGFDRAWRSGATMRSLVTPDPQVTWRDVQLDDDARTITVMRPLLLDLGAVAKGLAIDLAANELSDVSNFAIDAGGDLYLAGHNEQSEPWSVGVKHPRGSDALVARLRVRDVAVCTSGDYERRARVSATHDTSHIVDPRTGKAAHDVISATVIAPNAMTADALATTAFVLGAHDGLAFLEAHDVDGMLIDADMKCYATRGMDAYREHCEVSHVAR